MADNICMDYVTDTYSHPSRDNWCFSSKESYNGTKLLPVKLISDLNKDIRFPDFRTANCRIREIC